MIVVDCRFSITNPAISPGGEGGGGVGLGGSTWIQFCLVCAAGLSEPLPHYSLFCGQL